MAVGEWVELEDVVVERIPVSHLVVEHIPVAHLVVEGMPASHLVVERMPELYMSALASRTVEVELEGAVPSYSQHGPFQFLICSYNTIQYKHISK